MPGGGGLKRPSLRLDCSTVEKAEEEEQEEEQDEILQSKP